MAEEGSGARLVRNTLANGAGQAIGVLVSLILTPFLIDGLGIAAYGVFTLALTFTFFGGFAALADLGVEGAIVRYVAEARAVGDEEEVQRVVATGLAFFGAVALVLAPALAGIAALLAHSFPIPDELQDAATLTFAVISLQMLFDLPARALFAALEGAQRFDLFQLVEVLRTVVQTGLFAAVLLTDHGVVALAASMTASSVVVLLGAWVMVRRTYPDLRLGPRGASRSILRKLMTFGGGLLTLRALGTIYRQMDKIILASFLGVRPIAAYDVGNKLHSGAGLVMSVLSSALMPTSAYSRDRPDVLEDLYLRGSHYTVALTMPFVVAGFAFAGPLIDTWIGGEIVDDATVAAQLLFVYLAIVVPNAVGIGVIVGLGRLRRVILISLANAAINLAVSITAVALGAGIEGVVLGTVVAYAVTFSPQLRLCLQTFRVSLGHWAREVIRPVAIPLAVQAATAVPLVALAERTGSLPVVGALFLASAAIAIGTWIAVGLGRDARGVLLRTLRSAVGRA